MSERPAKEEAASKPFEPDCLHSMTFLTSTDVTNPREWYSFSSDTRLGVFMTVLNPETHTLLPTLPGSLAHQAVQSEKSTHGVTLTPLHHKSGRTRHSFSVLENVSRNDHLDSRNLKSILSSNKNNSHNNQSQSPECLEKASRVKFGENDVKFKDRSLPPIHDQKTDPTSPASSSKMKNSPEKRTSLNSPLIPLIPDTLEPRGKAFKQFPLTLLCHDTSQRSSATAHMPGNGFPEVCRSVTHTHDDYPEAYWELRSPTVHQPRDLKETMIDRERYRLQQISSLKLGAMSREATINKLDSYRKWNQQIQELSSKLLPSKSTSPQHTSTMANAKQSCKIASDAATNIAVNVDSDQTDDEVSKTKQKFLLPIHQQILDVPTQSNIPCNKTNSIISKLPRITNEGIGKTPCVTNEGIGKTPCVTNEGDNNIIRKGTSADNSCRPNSQLAESERPRHEKLNSPTKNWIDQGKEKVVTMIKPSVVNLCMVQEKDSHTKDILANIRHALITNPEKSERYRAIQPTDVQQEHQSGSVTSDTPNSMTSVDDGKISLSDSLPSIERSKVPFTPSLDITPPVEESEVDTPGSLDVSNKGIKKIIIKKFKKLDIFGEKSAATENTPDSSEECVVSVRSNDNRKPYLPQCRPPTYRLDSRSYPPQKDSEGKLRENAQAKGGLYSASPVTISSHLDLRSRH